MRLESEIIGTTNPSSPNWESIEYNDSIIKLLKTIKYSVYHTSKKYYKDMGYDHKGRRAPYIDSIDLYIWTIEDSKPVVHLYDIDPRSGYSFLRSTFTDYDKICSLSVEDDYGYDDEECDDTFKQVYDEMCRIAGIPVPKV